MTQSTISNENICVYASNGSLTYLNVSARPIFSEDGTWCGARGVCRDVTVDREREADLVRTRTREKVFNHIVNTFRDEVIPSNILNVAAETVARSIKAHTCHIFRRMPESFDADLGAKTDAPFALPDSPSIVCVYDDQVHEKLVLGASFGAVDSDLCQPILEKLADTPAVLIESLGTYSALGVYAATTGASTEPLFCYAIKIRIRGQKMTAFSLPIWRCRSGLQRAGRRP